ncbi:PA14 domain-containing protein [Spirosoma sp. KNUC1025]|uniref:PA14 domain-containing protein n=1 Tax=Spirosoma sp. KNUC1025 TaxID=2894082 RepID=UPI003866423F|nr:T9SS type A sorting domain-containing protein [Spirosoma sp. KNUC1025]
MVAFDGSKASTKYHLGGIRLSDNKWLWRTAVNTHWAYTGAYPADGSYDVGNGVNTTGIAQQVNGRVILWGYHGEFWKASQTNKYQLVYDNGLFLGSFGTTGHDTGIESLLVPPVGMAGNAFSGSLVKVGDDLYYYHNDENYHSGIHRWKILGLNTIQEQVIPIANPATLATKNTSSKNGLTGYYFNSGDLNNLLLKTTRVDAQLNFNWGSAVPNGASLSDASNYSVRWRGFLKTGYSEAYTLYIKAAKGVRVWIDDTLYLNKWTNNSLSEQKFSLPMVASERYAIRIETQASSAISLSWSSAHQTKEIIPASALFPNTDSEELTAKDLLSGLTYCGVLADGLYGWKRNPVAEDYTNANKDWWQAASGRKSYRQQSADLWVKYRQASGSYSVTRDLGVVNNASSWSLTGRISYEDNEGNNSGGGCYLEVLDKNGKVIARTYMNISYAGDKSITLFGNTAQLATGPSAVMNSIVDRIQPLSIVGSSSGITFSYAGYKPVTTSIFDASSDWRSPKSMRLLFIGGNDNGNTYNRIINIQSMQFAATSTAQSRVADTITDVVEVKLKVYPNPSQDVLNVEHAAIVDAGSISIFATDGQKVESYSLQNGSTSTTLNINSLSPGVYLLQYENGPSRSITRFIKQ